jgi:hypothetical protein
MRLFPRGPERRRRWPISSPPWHQPLRIARLATKPSPEYAIAGMDQNSSAYLIPMFGAFLLFIVKCYAFDNARVRGSPAFYLALFTVLLLLSYMTMNVMDLLVPYASLAFGIAGLVLLILAIVLFRI